MKLKQSLFSRREFLNSMLGGWGAALLAVFAYPVLRFVFPPYKEPDEVILAVEEYSGMKPNSVKGFVWGNKPGILRLNEDGSYTAFIGVCTHLDCNVTYLPERRLFFCACHEGWFDEDGINIGGPPPSPLRRLIVEVGEDEILVKKKV